MSATTVPMSLSRPLERDAASQSKTPANPRRSGAVAWADRVPLRAEPDVSSLVARARDGDAPAFRALYEEHVGRVYAVCLRMSGDRNQAEELTQRVFIRAWNKLGSFRGESLFSTWLHRLAVNEALGERRTSQRRERRIELSDDVEAYDGPTTESVPGGRLDLDRAISALPPGARRIFVLHDIEGYEHEEIARLTGIAPGTSKAQLHRARRILREALQ